MKIFGRELKKDDVLKKVGDVSQICDVKKFQYNDGASNGVRAVNVKCISGLDFTVLLDRGLDISSLIFKSIPLHFKSKVRETSPFYFQHKNVEILRTFYAGFLTTGGLSNTGWPCEDEDEEFGMHGRISNTSAEKVTIEEDWEGDDYKVTVGGKLRETKFFGDYLELERKITTYAGKAKLLIHDKVQNIGYRESPMMLLYHFNFGFPFLDKDTKLLMGKTKIQAGLEESEKDIPEYDRFIDPVQQYVTQLFYHDIEKDREGKINIALLNETVSDTGAMGIKFSFDKEHLPCVNQMKNMSYGEYVCSIEPGTNFVRGRNEERKRGNLIQLQPDEIKEFKFEIDLLESQNEIDECKKYFGQ